MPLYTSHNKKSQNGYSGRYVILSQGDTKNRSQILYRRKTVLGAKNGAASHETNLRLEGFGIKERSTTAASIDLLKNT